MIAQSLNANFVWPKHTVLRPLFDESGLELASSVANKRAKISLDAVLALMAGSVGKQAERLELLITKLQELGLNANPEGSQQLDENDLEHWQQRNWFWSLDYYLSSRQLEFYDHSADYANRQREIISQYLKSPLSDEDTSGDIELIDPLPLPDKSLDQVLRHRRTIRTFPKGALDQKKFSGILWHGLQRVRQARRVDLSDPCNYLCSYGVAFDFYLAIFDIEGLAAGLYRYDIKGHCLSLLQKGDFRQNVSDILQGQNAPLSAAFTIFFVADFERYQWRYRHERALRRLYIDVGQVAQHLVLVAGALHCGSFITPAQKDRPTCELFALDTPRTAPIYTITIGGM